MKRIISLFCILMTVSLLLSVELDARGGRGGGGRGGGGGGRSFSGGRSMNRSPSMSRTSRPGGYSRQASRPATRPASRPRTQTPRSRPGVAQRPSRTTPARNDVQNFLNNKSVSRPSQLPQQRPAARQGDRLQGRAPGQQIADRSQLGNNVRDKISQNHPNRGDWFNNDFWDRHDHRPIYDHGNFSDNWWKWATVAGVASWLNWDADPVYYDPYYYNGYGGYTEQPTQYSGSTQDYTQKSEQIEEAADQPASDEWMPLGVFAISKGSGTTVTPNTYMQLALNKDGLISGTYYNSTTDATYSLEGLTDKKSQKAAWKMVDSENSPILVTGIYDLTKEQLPVTANFADGTTQEMLLVRLDEEG